MKISLKIFSLALTTSMVVGLSAQKSKLVSAYNYNKSYERDKDCSELEKGIEAIELVTKNESTVKLLKTWYYGGNLYFNAALAPDPECSAKFPGALEKCYAFYLEAIKYNIEAPSASELDLSKEADQIKFQSYIFNRDTEYDEASYMRDILGQKFLFLANAFVNRGVKAFQAGDYEKALDYSQKSVEVNAYLGKVDSLGMFNSALSAQRLKKNDLALEYYSALASIKYGGPNIHLYIANIFENRQDTIKKIEAIRNGLKQYPDNADLIREELNYLLITGQTDKALANFDKAIANDGENAALFYNRGLIFDELKNTNEDQAEYDKDMSSAASDYNKALELDATFFDAAYNLGAMYYNVGVEWNNKASNYGLNETEKYKKASTKANEYFELAMPALEKAHAIDADDRNTIASLIKIYAIVGNDDKYLEMKKKLGTK